jgi:histone deacetylase 1/2
VPFCFGCYVLTLLSKTELNNISRTLLIHAHMPSRYWAEALATATHVLNRRPCFSVDSAVPYTLLHGTTPDYNQLRVFGCLCYPNLSATASHKLAPCSTACVFLGYPSSHKGYRCLDLVTKRIIISRHVVFDETLFPFSAVPSSTSDLDFLSAPNPAAARVAAPSLRDVERPRPWPIVHEDDDPAILVRGPLHQALPLAQVPASPPPAPAPALPAPLPADPRAIVHVYSQRPRPPPAQQATVPPADSVQQAAV